MSMPTVIRPMQPSDNNLIYNSWLKSYGESSDVSGEKKNLYYLRQKKLIDSILSRASVLIICNPEDEDQVYGYLVYEYLADNFILHWAYVKYTYRHLRLFKGLLDDLLATLNYSKEIILTHRGVCYSQMKHLVPHFYQPELAYG